MAAVSTEKKRVLIVDDSVFARKIVSDILSSSPRLEIVGVANDGLVALVMVETLKPDVITLDVEMPRLNGIETLRRLMKEHPTPVLMLSSLTETGANESMEALRLGAVDVMAKPHGSHSLGLNTQKDELIAKVLAAASVQVSHLLPIGNPRPRVRVQPSIPVSTSFPVVMIASSTGGPRALRTIVPELTTAAGCAYVLVQHLPVGFSAALARDLNNLTDLNLRESSDGDSLRAGDAIFAKAGYHTIFDRQGKVRITTDPPLWGVRPAADVTIVSAIPVFGQRLVGVVLTGMGRDGANGARLIKESGGIVIAEHESSCVVYGMPRAAIESGVVDKVSPLTRIPDAIHEAVMKAAKGRGGKTA
ncbi:MAG: chemotaxis response regulator protein-glutamate methylesterase [Armatimonadetes bacterium]|nr:chemotaxis response regulator protein-glutamate methylesterase [Armatimonadota bacterium]